MPQVWFCNATGSMRGVASPEWHGAAQSFDVIAAAAWAHVSMSMSSLAASQFVPVSQITRDVA